MRWRVPKLLASGISGKLVGSLGIAALKDAPIAMKRESDRNKWSYADIVLI